MRWTFVVWTMLLAVACSDGDDDGDGDRTCGDGECNIATCETVVRCPEDCGTCVGTGCDVTGSQGSCGEACSTSCDCVNQGELCTADYGDNPGRCIPTDCVTCETFDACSYTPNAEGRCETVSCS